MKKIIALASLIFCTGALSLTSCSQYADMDESIPLNPVLSPIKALVAEDGNEISVAKISDNDRTISLVLRNLESLNAVKVKITYSKRAVLVSPTDSVLTLDLTKPYQIVVNNLFKEVTYTVTVAEKYEIPKTNFQEYRLANDGAVETGPITNLWDGQDMKKAEDYGSIGYRNYLCSNSLTVDLGRSYKLSQFHASLYWAYTNVCPKKYQLWAYTKEGVPPATGDWSDWTLVGDIDNTGKTPAVDFPNGDNLYFESAKAPVTRYVRIKYLENYRSPASTLCSLCEITFWAYSK